MAKFIVSFDFELGWGSIENGLWKEREIDGVYQRLHQIFPLILSKLDALEIPVTWAFVGAMLEESNVIYLDHLPGNIKDTTKKFVSEASLQTVNARYLFDNILNTKVKHNFSSHTYSHLRFDYEGVDEDFIKTEMELFDGVCSKVGIELDSFVFPQNIERFHDHLRSFGYGMVRTEANKGKNYGRFFHLLSSALTTPPMSNITAMKNGMLRCSGSMLYSPGRGNKYRMPFLYRRAIRGIDHAIRTDSVFHIWLHPFNLAESQATFDSFFKVLEYLDKKRSQGLIEIGNF